MSQCERFKEYLDAVCGQVRWKKAHNSIARELSDHLEDQMNGFLEEGMAEDEAEQKAVLEMGDPVSVGADLDRAYRPAADWRMLLLVAALFTAGIILRLFFSGYETGGEPTSWILGWGAAGLAVFGAAYFIDYTVIRKYVGICYLGFFAGIIVIYLIAPVVNGRTTGVSAYLMFFPAIYAALVHRMKGKGMAGLLLCGFALCPVLFAALYVPSISSFCIVGVVCLVIVTSAAGWDWFLAGRQCSLRIVWGTAGVAASYFVYVMLNAPHRFVRVMSMFGIGAFGGDYLAPLARNVLGEMQFWGAAQSDIASFIPLSADSLPLRLTAAFGLVCMIVLAVVTVLIALWGMGMMKKQKNQLARMTSQAALWIVVLQAVNNLLFNVGIIIFGEFSFPILTGNTAMVVNMALMGLLLSAFRNSPVDKEEAVERADLMEGASAGWVQVEGDKLIFDLGPLKDRVKRLDRQS